MIPATNRDLSSFYNQQPTAKVINVPKDLSTKFGSVSDMRNQLMLSRSKKQHEIYRQGSGSDTLNHTAYDPRNVYWNKKTNFIHSITDFTTPERFKSASYAESIPSLDTNLPLLKKKNIIMQSLDSYDRMLEPHGKPRDSYGRDEVYANVNSALHTKSLTQKILGWIQSDKIQQHMGEIVDRQEHDIDGKELLYNARREGYERNMKYEDPHKLSTHIDRYICEKDIEQVLKLVQRDNYYNVHLIENNGNDMHSWIDMIELKPNKHSLQTQGAERRNKQIAVQIAEQLIHDNPDIHVKINDDTLLISKRNHEFDNRIDYSIAQIGNKVFYTDINEDYRIRMVDIQSPDNTEMIIDVNDMPKQFREALVMLIKNHTCDDENIIGPLIDTLHKEHIHVIDNAQYKIYKSEYIPIDNNMNITLPKPEFRLSEDKKIYNIDKMNSTQRINEIYNNGVKSNIITHTPTNKLQPYEPDLGF